VGAARAQHLSDVEVEVDAEWLNTYLRRNPPGFKEKWGGVLQFPNFLSEKNFRGFVMNVKSGERRPARMRYYTETEVKKILESVGFKILSLWYENTDILVFISKI
jgi:hypothetical protein